MWEGNYEFKIGKMVVIIDFFLFILKSSEVKGWDEGFWFDL